MIPTTRIWRWRVNKRGRPWLEVTEPGRKVDWIDKQHVYYQLGMVK